MISDSNSGMRMAVISSVDSLLSAESIKREIEGNVHGLEIDVAVGHNVLDIVKLVAERADYDFLVVVYFYSEQSPALEVVMNKLVELDLKGVNIMKFFEAGEEFNESDIHRISEAVLLRAFGSKSSKSSKESFTSL